ncbi:MAG TPA: hypothetical protein VLJ58_21635 [Ramlibacter sp.]|nr:hypothetical protein [Ramlibacter sp.]
MNADRPTILVPDQHGAPFEGGFYGGQITSHGGAKIFGIAWAPKAYEYRAIWLPNYKDVPNATSCVHSMDNTLAMAEAGSPAAQLILGKEINGHSDWCLAARDVMELGYRHLKPGTYPNSCSFRDGDNPSSIPVGYPYTEQAPVQTLAEDFRTGGSEAFEEEWYFTSTQYSADYAWNQGFRHGGQGTDDKEFEARWRPVRLIQLNP